MSLINEIVKEMKEEDFLSFIPLKTNKEIVLDKSLISLSISETENQLADIY